MTGLPRILILDDHSGDCADSRLHNLSGEFECMGIATNVEAASSICFEQRPDVVLVNMVGPEHAAIQAIRKASPTTQIVVVADIDAERVAAAFRAGAIGILSKEASVPEVARAIRAAHDGQTLLAPQAAYTLLGTTASGHVRLSERELAVLKCMAEGMTNPQIAKALYLSTSTIKTHVGAVLSKLNAGNRTKAVAIAVERGLLSSD